jgi:hypothetical protein
VLQGEVNIPTSGSREMVRFITLGLKSLEEILFGNDAW